MRSRFRVPSLLLLLAPGLAPAQEPAETTTVAGVEGRVTIEVPAKWRVQEPSGSFILMVRAPGSHGGHLVTVVREAGQDDVDKQRDRYLAYDSGQYPGAEVRKCSEPFFGYRLDHAAKDKVIVRAFRTDGGDGLVLAVSSRHRYYDRFYAETVLKVAGSLAVRAGAAADAGEGQPELEGGERRLYDRQGRVSLVAPGAWKPLDPEESHEMMCLGLKGSRGGPTLRLHEWGGPTNPSLVVRKVAREWKQSYSGLTMKIVGRDPPAILVKDRKPEWVDYVIGFEAGGIGYTLTLTVREGGFERFKTVADTVATTVVFADGAYATPKDVPGDITEKQGRDFVVHARAESAGTAKDVAGALGDFDRYWRRIAVGKGRGKPPLHVAVVAAADFTEQANGFGDQPAAYDRSRCLVVVTPPPEGDAERALWRGRLYASVAEASLHRDLAVPTPPWLRAGLAACMDACGRTGEDPEARHPGLVERLELKTSTDAHPALADVLGYSHADLRNADDPNALAAAWGYTHLMLHGGGTLASLYRKWTKDLEKATDEVPPFDLGRYDTGREDLAEHVRKRWGKR